jgi:transposase-like protein
LLDLLGTLSTEQDVVEHFQQRRWGEQVISPFDPNSKVYQYPNNWYKDKNTGQRFNVKSGTIFAGTKLPLKKWLKAMYLFSKYKKGLTLAQLAQELDVTEKTAWRILDKLRSSLNQDNFIKDLLEGTVEVDEAYLGGKNKNRHWDKKIPNNQVPVLGLRERKGILITQVIPDNKKDTLEPIIKRLVKPGTSIYTDGQAAYQNLGQWFDHQTVNHKKKEYVRGVVYTNLIENVWSHLKRIFYGIHYQVSKKHLAKYLDDFTWRFNTRKYSVLERFDCLFSVVLGKSFSYKEANSYLLWLFIS